MLDDYLEAITSDGIIEIFNNARTHEYAQAYGINGVKNCGCPCVGQLACDKGPYTCELQPDDCDLTEEELAALNICGGRVIPITPDSTGAPWWDDTSPGSFEYVGAYVLGSTGWDSTFRREVFSNSLSGSSFGAPVRDGRCITYDVVLIAKTKRGLEFGFSFVDEQVTNLDRCGFFTLGMAVDCPPEDCPETELDQSRRYLRRVTVGSGLEMISTRVTGCCRGQGRCGHFRGNGAVYGQAQITFCTEQPWIYTEPECCFDDQDFPKEEAACNISFIGKEDQEPPLYATRSVLSPRQKYNIEITRDGKICKVGDWDWQETQLGGGTGLVVLSGQKTAEAVSLTERTVTEETDEKCPVCQIVLYYDVNGDTIAYPQGPYWFETLGWNHQPGDPLPCDCTIEIAGIYTRNDSYDPDADPSVDPTSNQEWTFSEYSASNDTDGACCYLGLNFTNTSGGSWTPTTGDGFGGSWDPAGRDPFTQEQNFPPRGCNLVIATDCEDEVQEDAPKLWDGAIDGYTRISVDGPVTYHSDGSWTSADGVMGCLPGYDCAIGAGEEFLIPKIENSGAFDECEGENECPIRLYPNLTNTSDGTWKANRTDFFHDVTLPFPDVSCEYSIVNEQIEDEIFIDEEYQINSGSCDINSGDEFNKIFPSFESDCWKPVYIPNAENSRAENCFCSPMETINKCCSYTNPSSTYASVGSLVLRAGGGDLKNFRLKGWISAFPNEKSPCEDCNLWMGREVDFGIEVPHIPGGSVLRIDGESRRGTLEFPGGAAEPAIRYVTGSNGKIFSYPELGPCETFYLLAEASCYDTADNFALSMCFSNRYGASGGLLL